MKRFFKGFEWRVIVVTITTILARKQIAMWVIFIGVALNALAVFGNGGRMPVQTNRPAYTVMEDGRHTILHVFTRFKWACDIYPLGRSVFSLGDFFILGGICLVMPIEQYMRNGLIAASLDGMFALAMFLYVAKDVI